MQFDFAAWRQHVWTLASPHMPTVATAAGGTLAILLGLGGVWAFWPEPEITEDAVVAVAGPAFTPAIITAPAPAPAKQAASSTDEPATKTYDEMRRQDDRSLARAVQRELIRAGCYDGPVNGYWSPSTRRAMGQFTKLVNARLPVDHPDPILLVLLETHDKVSCDAGAAEVPGSAPPASRAETASIANERASSARESEARPAARYDVPEPPEAPRQATLSASAEETASGSTAAGLAAGASVAAAAGGAAALSNAAVAPDDKNSLREPGPDEPKKATRKRKPSFQRQVNSGFKKIQRSLKKLFW